MDAAGDDIHWAAIGVVGGVDDELIVGGNPGRGCESVAVIGLDDLLESRMRQCPSPMRIPKPPAFRNASCAAEMPLTMPAMPTVSSGRPHCLPAIETPPAIALSMSVYS